MNKKDETYDASHITNISYLLASENPGIRQQAFLDLLSLLSSTVKEEKTYAAKSLALFELTKGKWDLAIKMINSKDTGVILGAILALDDLTRIAPSESVFSDSIHKALFLGLRSLIDATDEGKTFEQNFGQIHEKETLVKLLLKRSSYEWIVNLTKNNPEFSQLVIDEFQCDDSRLACLARLGMDISLAVPKLVESVKRDPYNFYDDKECDSAYALVYHFFNTQEIQKIHELVEGNNSPACKKIAAKALTNYYLEIDQDEKIIDLIKHGDVHVQDAVGWALINSALSTGLDVSFGIEAVAVALNYVCYGCVSDERGNFSITGPNETDLTRIIQVLYRSIESGKIKKEDLSRDLQFAVGCYERHTQKIGLDKSFRPSNSLKSNNGPQKCPRKNPT